MRTFRGLADRGAAISTAVGVILVMYISWGLSLEWFFFSNRIAMLRLLAALVGFGLIGGIIFLLKLRKADERHAPPLFVVGGFLIFASIIWLPHGAITVWLALLTLAMLSFSCWLFDLEKFFAILPRYIVPYLIGQGIFFLAFLFFTNVRSYIPFATFELSLYQAEKWGNLTHLGSIMTSDNLPPKDIWWNEQPVNYYYGGHLLTATLAKATGFPHHIAFNLGLATVFALTMSSSFGFMLSLLHNTTRKYRLLGGVTWHSGMSWALFGAFAVTMFGNLDPFRQLMTRDIDWGVRFRLEKKIEEEKQEWRLRTGLPVPLGRDMYGAFGGKNPTLWPQRILGLIEEERAESENLAEEAAQLIERYEAEIESIRAEPERLRQREIEDRLYRILFTPQTASLFNRLDSVNGVVFREALFELLIQGEYDEISRRIEEGAVPSEKGEECLNALEETVREEMAALVSSGQLAAFKAKISEIASRTPNLNIFQNPVSQIDAQLTEFESLPAEEAHEQYARLLAQLIEHLTQTDGLNQTEEDVYTALKAAVERFKGNPHEVLRPVIGRDPTLINSENGWPVGIGPKPDTIRFTTPNVLFINFWDSSRAIKSSPPGERNSGTITEFPYFSAILGDHHPHHFALPFTLCALSACLALMRVSSRRKEDDATFFRRGWPAMAAMAFFIGAVFAVNIWDAVVLSLLYALVILTAFKNVYPSEGWRWVGLAGFVAVLTFSVALLGNSIPGIAPLFQSAAFYLLAIGIVFAASPVFRFFFPEVSPWIVIPAAFGVATAVIFVGALTAPGAGGPNPPSQFSVALRDAAVFVLILAIASSWTMGRTYPGHRWWYAAGGFYAIVGGVSLLVILPFQLFFESPLHPQKTILYEALPPILSNDLINNPNRFWQEFWAGSPVNPFPENIRTEFRDFFMHWGIFLMPIVIFTIARFIRFSNERKNGFAFMAAMLAFGITIFARNYLGFWAGAFSLGMATLALFFAFHFNRRIDGPVWTFLTAAFIWTWFVEALHFDDDYAGYLERYNTPFKIYYPLWPIFAGGMAVGIRTVFGSFRPPAGISPAKLLSLQEFWIFIAVLVIGIPYLLSMLFPQEIAMTWYVIAAALALIVIGVSLYAWLKGSHLSAAEMMAGETGRALTNWPAILTALIFFGLGMYYPIAATATRTHEFFTWPRVDSGEMRVPHRNIYLYRTLDSTRHLGDFPKYRQDYKAMAWARENIPRDAKVLELPGKNPYTQEGRLSTGSARRTIISWQGHQHQWRGRARPAPLEDKLEYIDEVSLNNLNPLFKQIYPEMDVDLDAETQNKLRLTPKKEQLEFLRAIFPEAPLRSLYRMREAIGRNDLNMMAFADRFYERANDLYRTKDRERARELFGEFAIDYVAIGKMERDKFGDGLRKKFENWGFEVVYNSAEERLQDDPVNIQEPTLWLKVPDDFPVSTDESAGE